MISAAPMMMPGRDGDPTDRTPPGDPPLPGPPGDDDRGGPATEQRLRAYFARFGFRGGPPRDRTLRHPRRPAPKSDPPDPGEHDPG